MNWRTLSAGTVIEGFIVNRFQKLLVSGVALASAFASPVVFGAAQVYTGITTSITDEVAAAMPVVLAIGGILLGIGVAFRLIRRAGRF